MHFNGSHKGLAGLVGHDNLPKHEELVLDKAPFLNRHSNCLGGKGAFVANSSGDICLVPRRFFSSKKKKQPCSFYLRKQKQQQNKA